MCTCMHQGSISLDWLGYINNNNIIIVGPIFGPIILNILCHTTCRHCINCAYASLQPQIWPQTYAYMHMHVPRGSTCHVHVCMHNNVYIHVDVHVRICAATYTTFMCATSVVSGPSASIMRQLFSQYCRYSWPHLASSLYYSKISILRVIIVWAIYMQLLFKYMCCI